MIKHFQKAWSIIKYNLQSLLTFEIIYRLVGLTIIFPLATQLFYLSIRLTGDEFIINRDFVEYMLSPYTIIIGLFLVLIVGIYITYEVVALSVIFHSSNYKDKIGLQTIIIASTRKMVSVIKRYHITIILSSTIFLVIVEGLQFVGIASTIQVPALIVSELRSIKWFYPTVVGIIITLFILFFETIFYELQCTIEHVRMKDNFKHSHQILRHNVGRMILEFLVLNGIINLILYIIYSIFIGLVGLFVLVVRGESFVFGTILTILYTLYLVIGFFASIILIPVNYAWINGWYYERKSTKDLATQEEVRLIRQNRPLSASAFRKVLSISSFVLLALSIVVLTNQANSPERIAFLNNPSIISHRGGGDYGPENTLYAIEQGIELGADAIEIDVRFTSDNVPILMHDERLGRTTNDTTNRFVSSVTLDQIKLLDAGSWYDEEIIDEQVPTLQEVFEFVDRRVDIYIEIKASMTDSMEILVAMIEEENMVHRVKMLSFNPLILSEIKELNDEIETVLLLSAFIGDINVLAKNDTVDNYGFYQNVALNNIEYVKVLQKAGKGVVVWTVNDDTLIHEVNNLGIDGIITDTPLVAREIVYSDTTNSMYRQLLEKLFNRT